jgi:hypothetical protein
MEDFKLEIQTGHFYMTNQVATLVNTVAAETYRYDFECFRMSALPVYKQEEMGDYIEQVWQGFLNQPQTDHEFERHLI